MKFLIFSLFFESFLNKIDGLVNIVGELIISFKIEIDKSYNNLIFNKKNVYLLSQ